MPNEIKGVKYTISWNIFLETRSATSILSVCVSTYSPFSFFFFFKQRCHLSKNQTNDLLESRLFIYCVLPISHLFMPLRNLNLPHAVQGNLADFALYCFLHAWVFKEDPSFEQQRRI